MATSVYIVLVRYRVPSSPEMHVFKTHALANVYVENKIRRFLKEEVPVRGKVECEDYPDAWRVLVAQELSANKVNVDALMEVFNDLPYAAIQYEVWDKDVREEVSGYSPPSDFLYGEDHLKSAPATYKG